MRSTSELEKFHLLQMLGDARCKIKRERREALHEIGNASLVVVTSYAFDDDGAEKASHSLRPGHPPRSPS